MLIADIRKLPNLTELDIFVTWWLSEKAFDVIIVTGEYLLLEMILILFSK